MMSQPFAQMRSDRAYTTGAERYDRAQAPHRCRRVMPHSQMANPLAEGRERYRPRFRGMVQMPTGRTGLPAAHRMALPCRGTHGLAVGQRGAKPILRRRP